MLTSLSIKNYALIENIFISFNKGLTVITGETGAGKSIVIDSIDLLLGARAAASVIRTGTDMCTITAGFEISKNRKVRDILSDLAIEADCEIIIRRQIESSGKSRAFINDMPVAVGTLANIGKHLVDFYAQHKSNMLFDQQCQRQIIDDIAGNAKLLENLSVKYDSLEKLKNKTTLLEASNADRERMLDLYNYQISEITKAGLTPDEEACIEKELPKLKNAEKIQNITQGLSSMLYRCENSVLDNLSNINKQIDLLGQYGIDISDLSKNVSDSISQMDDVYREIESLAENADVSPDVLDNMIERQQLIKKLKSKYAKTVPEILDYKEELETKVKEFGDYEFNIESLNSAIAAAEKEIMKLCEEISACRKKVSKDISKNIIKELEDLNMKNVQFEIDVSRQEITKSGFDKIEFMFSANKGENLYPLSLVASGGEISRVMLALATTVSAGYDADTVVFDEIDSGTSGKTGEKIGKKLKKLSLKRQIISISHLAQIASTADNHIRIYKETENDRNVTKMKLLNAKERIEEIAKIISGEKVTEHAVKHAEELIRENGF